jgi:hypothetical protein
MKVTRAVAGAFAVSLMAASASFADATVEQKTKVQLGGALGSIVNTFGGKAAREGVQSTSVVSGDRRLSRTESSGELVDLAEEKVYHIDYDRQTYKVVTFAEMRKQMEDARKRAGAEDDDRDSGKGEKGTEYDVDVSVKETGKKETINGFSTKQVIMTIVIREKGKKLEQSGGTVLTSDMWMTGKVAAMKEVSDFDVRYYKKLYGGMLSGAEMQQMAAMMATSPTFGKAMKAMSEKRASLEGTPVRTLVTFESVAGTEQKKEEASSSEDESASAASAMIGGLLGRMKKKNSEPAAEEKPTAPGHTRMFESTNELLRADGKADSAALAVPTGFKLKK